MAGATSRQGRMDLRPRKHDIRLEVMLDGTTRGVAIRPGDFSLLRGISGGAMQIDKMQDDYRRLNALGLVKHRFDDTGDWPIPIAVLTPLGEAVLAKAPPL